MGMGHECVDMRVVDASFSFSLRCLILSNILVRVFLFYASPPFSFRVQRSSSSYCSTLVLFLFLSLMELCDHVWLALRHCRPGQIPFLKPIFLYEDFGPTATTIVHLTSAPRTPNTKNTKQNSNPLLQRRRRPRDRTAPAAHLASHIHPAKQHPGFRKLHPLPLP